MGKISHGPGFSGNAYHAARRYCWGAKPPDGRIGKRKGWFPGCSARVRPSTAKPVHPITGKRPYKKRMTRAERWELFCRNLGIDSAPLKG